MSMEITGIVKHVGELQEFSSGFQKKALVIEAQEEGSQYKNLYGFELLKDNCSKLDGIEVGHEVEVKFNLGRCREWESKWYADMHTAWYIKKIEVPDGESERSPVADEDEFASEPPL